MIECGRFPRRGRMAESALEAEAPAVLIVFGMTRATLGGRAFEDAVDMAFFTIHFEVRAGQLEGKEVVIYGDIIPISGGVAGAASCAELTCVFIIFKMAGDTAGGCALIHIILMTLFAFDIVVLADKFEVGEVVVEPGGFPAFCRMADTAIRAKAALMRVVFQMTTGAILWRGF